MAPEGPYRYRSFNMLPVERRRSPVDSGAQRRALRAAEEGGEEGSGEINVVFWMRRWVGGVGVVVSGRWLVRGLSASEGVS